MKSPSNIIWPLSNPPALPNDRSITGEPAFRDAIEQWLEEALRVYLPMDLVCLVPAPLLPDSSGLDLPIDYLCRWNTESGKAIVRFGTVTAIFKEHGASVFGRVHEFYNDAQPVIVLIRKSSGGDDTTDCAIGRLCVLGVEVPDLDKPHVADGLTELFGGNNECLRIPPVTFKPLAEAIKESHLSTSIASRDRGLAQIVAEHCQEYPFYVPTLGPILPHAQVVMVLARSIHSHNWTIRRRFGAGGVTFLLKPSCKLTDDLIVRMIAVAQRVDGLLGSLHFATEDVARSKAATDALSILKHSVGNHLGEIATLAPAIAPHLHVLERMLQGAVGCARQRGIPANDDGQPVPWRELGFKNEPFDQTLKNVFWGSHDKLEFVVKGLNDGILDSRVLVLIEELTRNLAKGPEDMPGELLLECDPATGIGNVRIKGWATPWDLEKIAANLRAVRPDSGSLSLRGTEAVVRLVSSLQPSRAPAEYALGERGMQRREAETAPDTANNELGFNLWDQEPVLSAKVSYRPFTMVFPQLQFLIL